MNKYISEELKSHLSSSLFFYTETSYTLKKLLQNQNKQTTPTLKNTYTLNHFPINNLLNYQKQNHRPTT